MITYELALKLKEAGFPQKSSQKSRLEETGFVIPLDSVYIPSLSELIEACGEKFHGIYVAGGDWKAHGFKSNNEFDDVYTHGSTPEEAVANLYLALSLQKHKV